MAVGRVGVTPGPAFAAVDHFKIRILGTQTHGAYPHLGADPIVMASQAIMALQTIRSRNQDPLEPSVVTVGLIRAGERFNIIPDDVWMEGTVRTYDAETRDLVEQRMAEILGGITQAHGGTYELEYDRGTPATLNDIALTEQMLPTLERVVGAENTEVIPPTMGGEDFAYFALEVPGFFFRLGQVAPGTVSGGHHTADFRADDASIPVGMRAMANLLLDYLEQQKDATDG
jgi:amidohydrolase